MSDVARLHAMFRDACLGDTEAALTHDLAKHLARHGVAKEDAEALLASPRRLPLYRQLVRHNVTNVIGAMLERTRARLEHRVPGAFAKAVADWLAVEGPRTSHLRDVPGEFLSWIAPRWRSDDRLPSWLVDYAELELVDFTIGVAPRPSPPPPLADVAADRPLVFAEPRVLVRLGHAVHDVADDLDATPERRDVRILVYRDGEHRTRFLDLTPAAAAILEKLFLGRPLANAMVEGCKDAGIAVDDTVLASAARLLADLGERGVLLGARA
ncbi:MAG: putative DNA-binding domain-containing protein [Deltaproteobacteria bacterium]|nr:putative DNA-binding domain-containing protein [Deltaproteobacteria bacterium]